MSELTAGNPAIRVEHSNRASRIGFAIVSCALIALTAAPWWADRAELRLLSEIYGYVALASLWNLLAGYAGLVVMNSPGMRAEG
jgi:branched-chain amino acid transport system permease protein